jgi:hypothetical protein
VPICWENSLNIVLSKYFASSIVMCLGTPYQQIMFYRKKFNCGKPHICEWLRFYPFSEIFDYDHCEGVIALSWSQLFYNIDAPFL